MLAHRFIILVSLIVFGFLLAQPCNAEEKPLVYESDILPVFVNKCGKCHSEKTRKGELDLSSIKGLLRGGESGEPAVAETLDDSLLWIMIADGDMPPEEEPQLTNKERELVRNWIANGAKSEHKQEAIENEITQHDVLPILLLRCTTCHGPRLKKGQLDLRTPNTMLKGGATGPAFVAGSPDSSLMIQRIESQACPPQDLLLKFFVRRPPQSEVDVLRKWIAAKAPVVDVAPDVATTEEDPLITKEDRKHWAFNPPRVNSKYESIDEFILEELKKHNLDFSLEADRDTLIRRVYLDLIGLPPSLEDWKKWRNKKQSDWYQLMIEELLASPAYGERWGRYWLDVAGYADSEGGVSSDPVRAVAWKYRDYVIRSFNDDKPYDRMLLEQIAGDELIDYDKAPLITDQMVNNLVATGFLRMGIDQTGSRTMNFHPERLGVIGDAINVLGSGVMGLTMECARCHSHKYDPIPHRDYYRFKAIFQGAFDEHDWLTFKNRTLKIATVERKEQVRKKNPPLAKKLAKLNASLTNAIKLLQTETLRQHYPEQSEADRIETFVALKIADNNRTQPQRNLVEKLRRAEVMPDADQPQLVIEAKVALREIEQQIIQVRMQMEPPLTIRALWDRGAPSPTYILRRGDYDKPGRLVGPGVPSVLTNGRTPFDIKTPFPEGTPKTGRRLAFANWLIQPDHPLTSRVMVNRIWHHHFGTGLVSTIENFGVKGGTPSHPELLDWLALKFIEQGWSIKDMHRLMMNSRVYRQSSYISEKHQKIDPQNRLLSHMPLKRMDAESLRDSLLFISGKLDDTTGGPPVSVTIEPDGLVSANASVGGGWRRSVYLQYRRTEIPTMMSTFDYPEMGPNCVDRSVSTVSPQSLMLMNNKRIRLLAVAFADRVKNILADQNNQGLEAQVSTVYQLALSREPGEQEKRLGIKTLRELKLSWKGDSQAALETYCHTIFNSAAFLYID
ncbi:MAG: PSD1 domain-containing protein [Planctomycetaceae bacterium]|nr:PSD1 domain-containing protein [Planctomycetaceae bacterium]